MTSVLKPLLRIVDIHDAGQDVYFLSSGLSRAVHMETDNVMRFVRNKGVFKIDAEVRLANEGFPRHPLRVARHMQSSSPQ